MFLPEQLARVKGWPSEREPAVEDPLLLEPHSQVSHVRQQVPANV